ncbi:MAG: thiamine biosynthesis protein ThiJ [Candidatus Riflebacteria bacterium GWC2_50_8]|nr:MAG: thiamine biosynthesis protein ThiJ [Candidatus Riflebacteria bacterium GWC2_50_8]
MTKYKKKVGILFESDFYENEIFYYQHRFPEDDIQLNFLTRLWGNESLTFKGHEYHVPMECRGSFENMSDEELNSYGAIIVPAGMVADRLRWTEDVKKLPPATEFLARAFANKKIIKGIICHGLWLVAPKTELVKGRRLTCHNNLIGDAKAYGAEYVNEDLVVDKDLVTARSGGHCHLMAKKIIEMIKG